MYSSLDLSSIFTNLQTDCNNAIDWFTANGMKANPSKFQFMMISSERIQQQCLNIGSGITLRSEPSVKVLGVTINDRLHISACCLKASRQFNALSRISKHINLKSKSIIYNSFIASNFNYCPLVLHFCGTTNSNKLEKLQERSLRILYNDFESPIQNLMDKSGQGTLLSNRLKYLILEVFKSIRKSNAPCLHDIFVLQEVPYDLRTPKPEQPISRTTNYGLRTFSYLGSKLWNEFYLILIIHVIWILMNWNFCLKHWEGQSLDPTYRNYVWTLLTDLLFGAGVLHGWYSICFDLTFYTCIILIPSFISMYIMTLHCVYWLHFSYTSLLANVICC